MVCSRACTSCWNERVLAEPHQRTCIGRLRCTEQTAASLGDVVGLLQGRPVTREACRRKVSHGDHRYVCATKSGSGAGHCVWFVATLALTSLLPLKQWCGWKSDASAQMNTLYDEP